MWNKLCNFVNERRRDGISSFSIQTTADEFIMKDDPPDKNHPNKSDKRLRIKYQ